MAGDKGQMGKKEGKGKDEEAKELDTGERALGGRALSRKENGLGPLSNNRGSLAAGVAVRPGPVRNGLGPEKVRGLLR